MLHLHVTVFPPPPSSSLSLIFYMQIMLGLIFFFSFLFQMPEFFFLIRDNKNYAVIGSPTVFSKKERQSHTHFYFYFFKKNTNVVKTKDLCGIHALSVTLYFPYK